MKRTSAQKELLASRVGKISTEAIRHTPEVRRTPPVRSIRPRVLESHAVHITDEAAHYDEMVRKYAWLLNRPFVDLISNLGLGVGRVLDIGTGPGWIPIEAALRNPGWEIWAVDASADMLARARKHAEQAGVAEHIHFVHGSATELPFTPGFFDLTVSHFMLHHMEKPELMFNEAARVTRGGGKVVIKDLLRQSALKTKFLLAFSKYVLRYSDLQLQMYRESIDAALTRDEVWRALAASKLCMAEVTAFRGLDFVVKA